MKGDGSGIGGRGLLIASVAFILIVGAIFFAISGGVFNSTNTNTSGTQVAVTDILANRSVRMTVVGPIVANEDRESYRVEVGVDERAIEAFEGYDLTVVNSVFLGNNRAAYTDFAFALDKAGFGKVRNVSDAAADERGVCATGIRYIFEILDDGRSVSRLWATSCSKSPGTFNANSKTIKNIKNLFDLQIPDRTKILEPLKLR